MVLPSTEIYETISVKTISVKTISQGNRFTQDICTIGGGFLSNFLFEVVWAEKITIHHCPTID